MSKSPKGYKMFHEYRHVITTIKNEDGHFNKLFERHNELDVNIIEMEKNHVDQFEIEKHKKEKLKLKDEIHQAILKYKKTNNV